MDEIIEINKKFYDEYALNYDTSREGFYELEKDRIQNDLSVFFDVQAFPKVVLDVGCGTGFYALNAAMMGAQELHCIDISSSFLKMAKSQIEKKYPSVVVYTHQTDLRNFMIEKPEICNRANLFVMGAVLQYVPGYDAILQNLIRCAPQANYYISSTIYPETKVSCVEKALISVDYALYRKMKNIPKVPKKTYPKVTLKVDPEVMEQIFDQAGLNIIISRYTSFHTKFMSKLHQKMCNVIPNMGSYFTLIACQN